jgi:hypothetical protein
MLYAGRPDTASPVMNQLHVVDNPFVIVHIVYNRQLTKSHLDGSLSDRSALDAMLFSAGLEEWHDRE